MNSQVWFVVILILMLISISWIINTVKSTADKDTPLLVIFIIGGMVIFFKSLIPMNITGFQSAKELYEGHPIEIRELSDQINHTVWRPICPTRIGNDIIFYSGSRGRLYSLYGISFEPELTEENFLSATNSAYLVYRKGANLFIGPYNVDEKVLSMNSTK